MGKVIHWELCKKFKFDFMKKWYMYNPTSVLENDTHKLLCYFDGSLNPGQTTRPYNNQQKKKKKENLQNCGLCSPGWPQNIIFKKWIGIWKKKTVEHESDVYSNYNWCYWYSHERLIQRREELEIRGLVETIKTTALLRSARILRRILETCGDLLSLKLPWKTISVSWCEKLSKSNNDR